MPRTALVTGASRGLGAALSTALIARGWDLVVDARGADELARTTRTWRRRGNVHAIPGDITDPDHRIALAQAAADHGGLAALVLNAATLGPSPRQRWDRTSADDLRATLDVNVVAPMALTRVLLPTLHGGAAVIGITSDAAREAYEAWGVYGCSKAALEQALAVLAVERSDLRVHRVDPGDLRTRMHQAAFPGEDISDRPPPDVAVPGLLQLVEGQVPSGRYRAADLGDVGVVVA
jgi:NAD(P)-dependent dehydrogenase (short-subunit alcohol dehydrogenase family)